MKRTVLLILCLLLLGGCADSRTDGLSEELLDATAPADLAEAEPAPREPEKPAEPEPAPQEPDEAGPSTGQEPDEMQELRLRLEEAMTPGWQYQEEAVRRRAVERLAAYIWTNPGVVPAEDAGWVLEPAILTVYSYESVAPAAILVYDRVTDMVIEAKPDLPGSTLNESPVCLAIPRLRLSADLNGDGSQELVETVYQWNTTGQEGEILRVYWGKTWSDVPPKLHSGQVHFADMDGDGVDELYYTGDAASDDYLTYGWRLGFNGLEPMTFSGDDRPNRASNGECAEGELLKIEDGVMTLRSYTHTLGSHYCTRDYVYGPDGTIAPVEGTLWVFEQRPDDLDRHTLRQPLPVTIDGGADILPAGTELWITQSDCKSLAWFETTEEVTGTIAIEPYFDSVEDGSYAYWKIAGLPEQYYFGELPYAG